MKALPLMGIKTQELIDHVSGLLSEAENLKSEFRGVNWGDIGISDIEYRLTVMDDKAEPYCVVTLEEASPNSNLSTWIYERLDKKRFPRTFIECEW